MVRTLLVVCGSGVHHLVGILDLCESLMCKSCLGLGKTSVVLRFDEATREIMKLEKGTVR